MAYPYNILSTAERAATADERTTLETFLDYYRDAIVEASRRGLSARMRHRRAPSAPEESEHS